MQKTRVSLLALTHLSNVSLMQEDFVFVFVFVIAHQPTRVSLLREDSPSIRSQSPDQKSFTIDINHSPPSFTAADKGWNIDRNCRLLS